MRIIGGKHGGRRLRTTGGLSVRPTSDRLRETLFNILGTDVAGSSFLDLCAGFGAVGIEALSRGAERVVFVDKSRQACSAIRANLDSLEEQGLILNREAETALRQLERDEQKFDIVYFDPPYSSEIYERVLRSIDRRGVLASSAIVVVEHRSKMPPDSRFGELCSFRTVIQGESALAFYAREEGR